jgi:hypothetical protein
LELCRSAKIWPLAVWVFASAGMGNREMRLNISMLERFGTYFGFRLLSMRSFDIVVQALNLVLC